MRTKIKEWYMRANRSEIIWQVSLVIMLFVGMLLSPYPILNIFFGTWAAILIFQMIQKIFFTK